MLFNSYEFIFYFLPIVFAGYFLLNKINRYQWAKFFLIMASLFFYGYYQVSYIWIILCSIAINYGAHLLLTSAKEDLIKWRKIVLISAIVANVGLLYYFKYFNFTLEVVGAVANRTITFSKIALPLGISFFTFQQIGFVVDSYKQSVKRQDMVSYSLFVTFFPQLVAGPIVNHEEMLPQFNNIEAKKPQMQNLYLGARAFIYGLAKKVLIADTIGQAVNWGYQYHQVLDGFNTILVILMYSLQLYYDFSGYCDMARGLGYLFNIKIALNFDSPFKAKNLVEFWKRWHMTLGRFFTRYVYIPLGGNRKGFARSLFNVFVVFTISGIWHGAGWTFVVWGLLHALMQILTRLWWKVKERGNLPQIEHALLKKVLNAVCIIGTFGFVAFAFGIFRADSLSQFVQMLSNLKDMGDFHIFTEMASFFCLKEVSYVLRFLNLDALSAATTWQMVAFLLLTGVITWAGKNVAETEANLKVGTLRTLLLVVLFVWSVLSLAGVSTFLYFNF